MHRSTTVLGLWLITYRRLGAVTVQTGLITALCAIINLILFLIFVRPIPSSFNLSFLNTLLSSHQPTGLHLIFNLPLSKLYTNSLMSSLNSRSGWQYSDSSQIMSQNANRSEQQRGVSRVRNVNMLKSDRRVSLRVCFSPPLGRSGVDRRLTSLPAGSAGDLH